VKPNSIENKSHSDYRRKESVQFKEFIELMEQEELSDSKQSSAD
jgi:hypothetical protein